MKNCYIARPKAVIRMKEYSFFFWKSNEKVNSSSGECAFGLCLDTDVLTGIWAETPVLLFITDSALLIMGVIATVMICKMKKEEIS